MTQLKMEDFTVSRIFKLYLNFLLKQRSSWKVLKTATTFMYLNSCRYLNLSFHSVHSLLNNESGNYQRNKPRLNAVKRSVITYQYYHLAAGAAPLQAQVPRILTHTQSNPQRPFITYHSRHPQLERDGLNFLSLLSLFPFPLFLYIKILFSLLSITVLFYEMLLQLVSVKGIWQEEESLSY